MSTLHSIESAAAQVAHARLGEAERARLARSARQQQDHPTRRTVASVLRHWADRLEPERPCLDC